MRVPRQIDEKFITSIVNSMPQNLKGIVDFVSTMSFRWDRSVRTAAMKKTGKYHMLLNPDFIAEVCESYEHIAVIVTHELLHKSFFLLENEIIMDVMERGYDVDVGLLFDVFINSLIFQIMPERKYQTLFEKLFSHHKDYGVRLMYYKSKFDLFILRRLHKRLYSPMSVSYTEVARILTLIKEVQQGDEGAESNQGAKGGDSYGNGQEGSVSQEVEGGKSAEDNQKQEHGDEDDVHSDSTHDQPVLLGDHAGTPFGDSMDSILDDIKSAVSSRIQEYQEEMKEDIMKRIASRQISYEEGEKLIEAVSKEAGYSNSSVLESVNKVRDIYRKRAELKKRVKKVLVPDVHAKIKGDVIRGVRSKTWISTAPNMKDKKAVAAYSIGEFLRYYKSKDGKDKMGKAVVFVDVSGSQEHIKDYVIRLVKELKGYVKDEVYFFSNVVDKVSLKNVRNYTTTYGTDFDCVAETIKSEGISSAIIFTDGIASASPENCNILRKTKLFVVYTEAAHGSFLDKLAEYKYVLKKGERHEHEQSK